MTLTERSHSLVNKFYEYAKDSEVISYEKKKSDRLKLYCAKQCAVLHLELMVKDFELSDDLTEDCFKLIKAVNNIREI